MIAPSARNDSIGMSRKNEMYGDAGVCATRLGKFSATMPNGRDEHLADDLAPSGETEAPLLAHLQVVVDEADGAETHHHPDDRRPEIEGGAPPVSVPTGS